MAESPINHAGIPTPEAKKPQRVFGFLQGPSSFFFDLLADAAGQRGAEVLRVCFCPGDRLFWRRKGYQMVRSGLARWPETLERLIERRGLTDLVMLGDGRPRHAAAIAVAKRRGVTAHVVEHGYFRPDWLTYEIGGMGAQSSFDPSREAVLHAPKAPALEVDKLYQSSFAAYAAMDVAYNLSNLFLSPFTTPRYRGHSTVPPLLEYGGWLWKLAREDARRRRAARQLEALEARSGRRYLVAMQLENDYQITTFGAGRPQRALLPEIIQAFARAASADAALIVKLHPMDNGLIGWRRRAAQAARQAGVADRIWVLDGGDLDALLLRAAGLVTVNSTVGFRALALGAPTLALGRALYDQPGLTHQGDLESFFAAPTPPEADYADAFLRALLHATQVRGAFDGEGAQPGAAALADRMLAGPAPERPGPALPAPNAPAPEPAPNVSASADLTPDREYCSQPSS